MTRNRDGAVVDVVFGPGPTWFWDRQLFQLWDATFSPTRDTEPNIASAREQLQAVFDMRWNWLMRVPPAGWA